MSDDHPITIRPADGRVVKRGDKLVVYVLPHAVSEPSLKQFATGALDSESRTVPSNRSRTGIAAQSSRCRPTSGSSSPRNSLEGATLRDPIQRPAPRMCGRSVLGPHALVVAVVGAR